MFLHNFWIMDASVSALVFLSNIYGEKMQRTTQPAHVSKSLEGTKADHQEITATKPPHGQKKELHFVQYLCLNFSYFAAMGLTVVILQYCPSVMIALQHIAVMGFIVIAFAQWIPFKIGYLLGITFGTVWLFSVRTQFRWIINNLIYNHDVCFPFESCAVPKLCFLTDISVDCACLRRLPSRTDEPSSSGVKHWRMRKPSL